MLTWDTTVTTFAASTPTDDTLTADGTITVAARSNGERLLVFSTAGAAGLVHANKSRFEYLHGDVGWIAWVSHDADESFITGLLFGNSGEGGPGFHVQTLHGEGGRFGFWARAFDAMGARLWRAPHFPAAGSVFAARILQFDASKRHDGGIGVNDGHALRYRRHDTVWDWVQDDDDGRTPSTDPSVEFLHIGSNYEGWYGKILIGSGTLDTAWSNAILEWLSDRYALPGFIEATV